MASSTHWIVPVLVHGYEQDSKKSPLEPKSGNKQHVAESLMMYAMKKPVGRISEAQRACCAIIPVCKQTGMMAQQAR